MRRIKIRTVLAIAALTGAAGGIAYGVIGPWAPHLAIAWSGARTIALDSTTEAGLNLQALTVEGRIETRREDLIVALDLERGTPILAIDVDKAREAIETLPWVKSAKVERRLPGGVHIELSEYKPFALWQRGDRYTLVARDGTAIVDVPGADQNLPLIVGPDAPEHAAEFFETLNTINSGLSARVVAAVRIGGRRWNVHFDNYENGVAVRLPQDGLAGSWTRLSDLERDYRILERDLAFIDLRIPGQLIVRINENSETPSADAPTVSSEIDLIESGEQQEI